MSATIESPATSPPLASAVPPACRPVPPPGGAAAVGWRCGDCERVFFTRAGDPAEMETFEDMPDHPEGGRYGLACPWCLGWAGRDAAT